MVHKFNEIRKTFEKFVVDFCFHKRVDDNILLHTIGLKCKNGNFKKISGPSKLFDCNTLHTYTLY